MSRSGRKSGSLGDVAIVCGKDEHGLHILRRRAEGGPIEAGVAEPLVEGKPISGEVISMKRRADLPFLFDVKTELPVSPGHEAAPSASPSTPPSTTTMDGPPQVATESYRRGWDAIWGRRAGPGALN